MRAGLSAIVLLIVACNRPIAAAPFEAILTVPHPFGDISSVKVFARDLDPGVTAAGQSELMVVVNGETVPLTAPPKHPLRERSVQVWLLCADGTIVRQTDKVGGPVVPLSDQVLFFFAPRSIEALSGVVVSVDGTMFVHELKVTK
jgi:hypothetical protein